MEKAFKVKKKNKTYHFPPCVFQCYNNILTSPLIKNKVKVEKERQKFPFNVQYHSITVAMKETVYHKYDAPSTVGNQDCSYLRRGKPFLIPG